VIALLFVIGGVCGWSPSTNDCETVASARGEQMKATTFCDHAAPDILKFRAW